MTVDEALGGGLSSVRYSATVTTNLDEASSDELCENPGVVINNEIPNSRHRLEAGLIRMALVSLE
ncbi:hypothetical protein K239x_12860 [Planctomycetes bacterium K23_9]|uniref:Uncharacterized protein n=1 Tax=Stieleria marina TaxID=1930275 RepID=A0A517NQE9_9BACT|nr:hypothetical protein K239x_12860 [Planctomycetes bacterium K23_9]